MNFLEAVKAMKEGKKVRYHPRMKRTYFLKNDSLHRIVNGELVYNDLDVEGYLATDWEVVEEKKRDTLSDKIINKEESCCGLVHCRPKLDVEDVKNFLEELRVWFLVDSRHSSDVLPKLQEIFGKELVKYD